MLLCVGFMALSVAASKPVDDFVASRNTNPSSVSVYVYDLKKKRMTEGYNESVPLIPASITKALTVATTLLSTGIDYQYHTRVYYDGKVEGNVLNGNLIVYGSGDPSLGSRKEPKSANFADEIVGALKRKRITSIKGQLLFDQSCFPLPAYPDSWTDGNKRRDYGAGCYGFNYGNNAEGERAVMNPALTFDGELRRALSRNGIAIEDNVMTQGRRTKLTEHVSPPIDDIMRSCIRRSDNMFAEAFLRTYARVNHRKGTPAEGAGMEMDYWRRQGVDMTHVNVVDGSGLSRSNRLTAKFLGQVLQKMASNVNYVSYFPLAGQEGTLRSFLKGTPLDSYIALKTGSMSGIQCYAGYKLDYNFAPTHVVVVMVNNLSDRSALRKDVERMLLDIFKNE